MLSQTCLYDLVSIKDPWYKYWTKCVVLRVRHTAAFNVVASICGSEPQPHTAQ